MCSAQSPHWDAEVVGEGCFLTAVLTLEPQAWTGRGMRWVPPTPALRAVGGQEVRAIWDHPGLRRGWLAARGFILPKGQIPRRVGVVSEGLGFGELLWSPDGKAKSPPAESWHPPGVALLSETGLRGRRCGNRRGGEVGRGQDSDSPGSAARWL